jgi:branched-subunit amino acid transport protein
MTTVWLVVAACGVGTLAIKATGPILLGGRELPAPVQRVTALAGPALLAALVAINTFADGQDLVVDERVAGMVAAAIAVWRRAPALLVVAIAAATTALVRAIT